RSAGAILPLTQSQVDHSLGTRHRAAIGLSEETDAIVIVVSEETSQVAVAIEGRLERDIGADRLREILLGRLPVLDTALEPAGVRA
ncbi:MAG: diadenylate cyclase, partial [Gemmatimonadota bacterium]|nr:diadenylate cyclase [Gemmatimonadota bacterium]